MLSVTSSQSVHGARKLVPSATSQLADLELGKPFLSFCILPDVTVSGVAAAMEVSSELTRQVCLPAGSFCGAVTHN